MTMNGKGKTGKGELEESGSDLDVYKYRRIDISDILLNPNPVQHFQLEGVQNIYSETDGTKKQKTYAIVREPRVEFTDSKLRKTLHIYSSSAWKSIILTALFTSYLLDSSIYTFYKLQERPFWIIILLICFNFIFTLDVIVFCGMKCSKKWRKTLNLEEPDTKRVILDIVLAMPFSFIYLFSYENYSSYWYAISPLAAFIRAYRITEYFYKKSSQAGSNQWTSFLFQYLILFILSVHTWTCIWFLFSDRSFIIKNYKTSWSILSIYLPSEVTFDWYFICLYWSVMFLTTNSLGDLYPITTIERITGIVAILLGLFLTTIVFVGSLTSQFITITTRRSIYVRQLTKIKNYLNLINMDQETTKRIIRYYEDLWYQKSGVFKPKFLSLLPYPLQMEICFDLNAVPLYSSLVFRKLPEAFLRRLSLEMTHRFYLPGDIVYNNNQPKIFMVCITSGVLELLSDEDDESPMVSFGKGTCFGEIALVYNVPARCTVKSATYTECQVLDKTNFIKLMSTYPQLKDQINKEIGNRIKRAQQRQEKISESANLVLNMYSSTNRKKSSIKCLKEKLRYLQGKTDKDIISNEELDFNCLNLYVLSDGVKKNITSFTCLNSTFPWILEHNCILVKYWEYYMLLIVLYICIVYPYFIGMKRTFTGEFLFYCQIIINISLLLNIVVTCVTAVKTKKKYIKEFRKILTYRMNTLGFYLDVIAIIPFEYLITIHSTIKYHDNYMDHLFYLCKGTKMCLFWRLSNYFQTLEQKLLLNSLIIKIAKYCVYISLFCYWCGIILYMESCFVARCSENSWFGKALLWESKVNGIFNTKTKYPIVTSVYFSTTILLSVGYGDYVPGDKHDMAFVAFLSLYGVLMVGYCISEFSAVVTHWSRTKTAFLEVIITINKFMVDNNMHPWIKSRIMAFYELQWQYNSGVELTENNWLEETVIPSELRKKVLHQARFKTLTSITFFHVKNIAYIQTLTESARDIILPPGEIVYYSGTVSRELYIIESGYCLLTSKERKETKNETVIGPGNHLGLLVLLYGVPTVSTVITLTHCKFISVSHSAFTSALSLFPDMKEHENLLTKDELSCMESQAKSPQTNSYANDFNRFIKKSHKNKITNIYEDFIRSSFINVYSDYKIRKKSYIKSYKQFNMLNYIAPYILMPFTIHPSGIFIQIWAIIRVITAVAMCIIIPIAVSMAPMCRIFNIPLAVLEAICYMDLYLMLHVAYYGTKNQLVYHPYLTAKNYLKGSFIMDFLTCFPWYIIWKIFIPKHNEYHTEEDHLMSNHEFHCILRMTNILQLYKVYAAFWADSIAALKRAYFMSVVQCALLTIVFLNIYASVLIIMTCRYVVAVDSNEFKRKISRLSLNGPYMNSSFDVGGSMVCQRDSWIGVAKISKDEILTPSKVYLLAYYWSASSFTGAGFGDITAQETAHMILSIFINLHGLFFFGYVYAKIASLKAVADQVVTKFQENLHHLDLFLNREKVAFSLKRNIMEFWNFQWKRTGGWSHQSILGKLHANLNEDAVLYMYERTLREIPLFENVEYSFFRAFAKKLKEEYFQKGYMVIRNNEVISTMYIIYRGKVDILSDINEVEACMGPGGIFGNIKGVSKYLTMSNIVASRNIDLLCIEGREFYALLKSYPSVLKKVKRAVESAIKDYVLPTVTSESNSEDVQTFPISYETGDDDEDYDDIDFNMYLESPQKSIAESRGSRSITSTGNIEYVPATLLLLKPHRWFRSSILPDSRLFMFMDEYIRTKWKNLKDGYTKYKKNCTTNNSNMKIRKNTYVNWLWAPYLVFLDGTFKERKKTYNNVSETIKVEDNSEDSTENSADFNDFSSSPSIKVALDDPLATTYNSRKRQLSEEQDDDGIHKITKYIKDAEKKDSIDLLFASYAKTLKELNPRTQSSVKLKLAKVFADAEMENLQSQSTCSLPDEIL